MKCFIVLCFIIGSCLADLPTEVPDIPDLDDIDAIKERCDKKGGPGVYEKVKKAINDTKTCLDGIIVIDKFKTELEESKKTGSMDEVFAKYCNKRSQLKDCLKKTYDAAEPCLEENEKKAINVTANILQQIGDFVCFKDGDRLAMFVAEGGVECIKSRADGIKDCFNRTLKINPLTLSQNSIPTLSIDQKKCDNINEIRNCVVKDLEDNCEESTPANIIDALFRFIKKTACKDVRTKRSISLKRQIRSALATSQAQIREQMERKIKAACTKNGGSFDNLMTEVNDTKRCLTRYRLLVTPVNIFTNSIADCTKGARKAFSDCLADSEKYYPDFALQSFIEIIKFAYGYANIFSANPENIEIGYCMKSLSQDEAQKDLMRCVKESGQYNPDEEIFSVPPKSDLCEKMKSFDSCLSDLIKNNCVRDIKITKLINGLITAIESPCQGKNKTENEA